MKIDEIIEIVREAGNILLTAKRPKVMESHTWPLSTIPMMT